MPSRSISILANQLQQAVDQCTREKIDLNAPPKASLDFKSRQKESYRAQVWSSLAYLEKAANESNDPASKLLADRISSVRLAKDLPSMAKAVMDVCKLAESIEESSVLKPAPSSIKLSKVPAEIRSDIEADVDELQKCFASGCYRSSVIICGRILETALHRKYFEATGNDLLEKAPGTGLGNLIAKLAEKNVIVDPALGNQIHLINQVRVHSVHVKQQPFNPTKNQTHAIMLYTMDVVEKLFGK